MLDGYFVVCVLFFFSVVAKSRRERERDGRLDDSVALRRRWWRVSAASFILSFHFGRSLSGDETTSSTNECHQTLPLEGRQSNRRFDVLYPIPSFTLHKERFLFGCKVYKMRMRKVLYRCCFCYVVSSKEQVFLCCVLIKIMGTNQFHVDPFHFFLTSVEPLSIL